MEEAAQLPFVSWESFYVIVGSSAAALTGLQFVVMALVAESNMVSTSREIDAFGTPTVVHFCAALLVSAILSAPWHGFAGACLVLGGCGVAGLIYTGIVVRRARHTGYKPVLEDWIWHTILPFIAYAILIGAAIVLRHHPEPALFTIAAVALLLLFIGIHNSWDTVTYIAVGRKQPSDQTRG